MVFLAAQHTVPPHTPVLWFGASRVTDLIRWLEINAAPLEDGQRLVEAAGGRIKGPGVYGTTLNLAPYSVVGKYNRDVASSSVNKHTIWGGQERKDCSQTGCVLTAGQSRSQLSQVVVTSTRCDVFQLFFQLQFSSIIQGVVGCDHNTLYWTAAPLMCPLKTNTGGILGPSLTNEFSAIWAIIV